MGGFPGQDFVIHDNLSGNQRKETHQAFEQGGFSCSIASQQTEDFSLFQMQTDLVKNFDLTVTAADLIQFQHHTPR